eukprot:1141165-Pelagomonas_calceolata.AAC.3
MQHVVTCIRGQALRSISLQHRELKALIHYSIQLGPGQKKQPQPSSHLVAHAPCHPHLRQQHCPAPWPLREEEEEATGPFKFQQIVPKD